MAVPTNLELRTPELWSRPAPEIGWGPTDVDPPDQPPHRPHVVLWVALTVLGIWLLAALATLFMARGAAMEGLDGIQTARDTLSIDALSSDDGLAELREASRQLGRSQSLVRSPVLAPLRVVPLLGRQVQSVDALAGAATAVIDDGIDHFEAVQDRDAAATTNDDRIELLREIGDRAAALAGTVAAASAGPSGALFPPLASARNELASELDTLAADLRTAETAVVALADLLEGPSEYLVLAANNAEMRAGSGMFLSIGPLAIADGEFDLDDLEHSSDMDRPGPGAITLDPDVEARWAWALPDQEWRNLALTPRFEATARQATDMWDAIDRPAVDGVLAVDAVALEALLEATGPIEVNGRTVSADTIVAEVTQDQYRRAEENGISGDERRDQLGPIAEAAIAALQERDWDVTTLAARLADAAAGRHLLVWSADPVQQQAWDDVGVSGALDPNSVLVSILNQGSNKLDSFLEVDGDLALQPVEGGVEATITLDLRNVARADEVPYIAQPSASLGLPHGTYPGIVSVNLPGAATDVDITGGTPVMPAAADGVSQIVGAWFRLDRDDSRQMVVRFFLPDGIDEIIIEPSGRVPEIEWDHEDESWSDFESRTIPL